MKCVGEEQLITTLNDFLEANQQIDYRVIAVGPYWFQQTVSVITKYYNKASFGMYTTYMHFKQLNWDTQINKEWTDLRTAKLE